MFTIDLLRGQGVPVKSRPEGIAISIVAFTVPVVVAMIMFGCYLSDRVNISVQKQQIAGYDSKIDKLADAVKLQESFEKEQGIINSCLSEAASAIGKYAQWSPVLTTLVENMPDSMVLTKLEVRQRSVKKKVPRKDDPEKMMVINVPVRILRMNVCGKPQNNYDRQVREFRDRLRSSDSLGPKLEDIRVSQEIGRLDGQDVIAYQMECVFKPQL